MLDSSTNAHETLNCALCNLIGVYSLAALLSRSELKRAAMFLMFIIIMKYVHLYSCQSS